MAVLERGLNAYFDEQGSELADISETTGPNRVPVDQT
jgi:hypothetical protein